MLQLVIPYGTRSRVTVIAFAECRWSFAIGTLKPGP